VKRSALLLEQHDTLVLLERLERAPWNTLDHRGERLDGHAALVPHRHGDLAKRLVALERDHRRLAHFVDLGDPKGPEAGREPNEQRESRESQGGCGKCGERDQDDREQRELDSWADADCQKPRGGHILRIQGVLDRHARLYPAPACVVIFA
jgi:hypothetical protein